MATGGASPHSSSDTFKLVSGIQVTVTKDDIFKTTAEGLVVGEDASLSGVGGVAIKLAKISSKEFQKVRDKFKSDHKSFVAGKVYSCDFPSSAMSKFKDKVSFSSVLYAIVPPRRSCPSPMLWNDAIKKLYYHAMTQADGGGKHSLALPVLGSGGAGATFDEATDVLVEALATFRFKNGKHPKLQDVFVHCQQKEAYEKMVDKLGNERSVRPVSPGSSSASGASASGSRSSSSTKRGASNSGAPRPTSREAATVGTSSRNASTGRPDSAGKSTSKSKSSSVSKSNSVSGTSLTTKSGASKSKSSGKPNGLVGAGGFPDDMSNLAVILGETTLDAQAAEKIITQVEQMEIDDCEEEEEEEKEQEEEAREEKIEEKKVVEEEEEEDRCPICLDEMTDPKKLDKCGHTFCRECIEGSFLHHKPACPTCNTMYGLIKGNQPPGSMTVDRQHSVRLPGFQNYGTIVIDYLFPNGIQGKEHPNPGHPFSGTHRRAFLPDSDEGRKVCRLLRVAFDNRLTFTVGRSVTTGADNVVTWNDIHHKTSIDGGPTGFGFPDPHYLSRVQEELAAKGVTAASLEGRSRFDV